MLEAMAHGVVPAVTRASSGVDGVVRDGVNGIVVEVGNIRGLADRICKLSQSRNLLQDMGRQAAATAAAYDINILCEQFVSVFDRVMLAPVATWPEGRALEPELALEYLRFEDVAVRSSDAKNPALDRHFIGRKR